MAMPESILERFHRRQVEAIQETWQEAHEEMLDADLADRALEAVCGIVNSLRAVGDSVFERVRNGEVQSLNMEVARLRGYASGTLDALKLVEDWGRKLIEDYGTDLRNLRMVADAIRQVEEIQKQALSDWVEFTQEDVAQGLAEHARGETQDIDTALSQATGLDKELLERRLENHKRSTGR
jgi:hypothetical protein